jgi:hypothetical protein
MKKILLFLIASCGCNSTVFAEKSFFGRTWSSFLATVTLSKKQSSESLSKKELKTKEQVRQMILESQKTKPVVYHEHVIRRSSSCIDLERHPTPELGLKIPSTSSNLSSSCPTPSLGMLTPSSSQDDLSLLGSRERSTSNDFGYFVIPESPKSAISPESSPNVRSHSSQRKTIQNSLQFHYSSFGSTTSSYGELKAIEEQNKNKRRFDHITPPVSPITSDTPDVQ